MGKRGTKPNLIFTSTGKLPKCPFKKSDRPEDYAAWQEIVKLLKDAELDQAYQVSDALIIEQASVELARARKWSMLAAKALKADEVYAVTNANGQIAHAALREETKAWTALSKTLQVLGLTPRARRELGIAGAEAKEDLDSLESDQSAYLRAVK